MGAFSPCIQYRSVLRPPEWAWFGNALFVSFQPSPPRCSHIAAMHDSSHSVTISPKKSFFGPLCVVPTLSEAQVTPVSYDNNRDSWLDWCRVFAIFAVVLVHVVDQFYPVWPLEIHKNFSGLQRIVALILFTMGRLGVPMFLFLSGYLLPDRYAATSTKAYLKFLKKKWLPLFLCIEFWDVVYVIAMSALGHCKFSIGFLLSCLSFSSYPPLSHVWYMGIILGLYLVIPILGLLRNVFGKWGIFILFVASRFCHPVRLHFPIFDKIDLSFLGDYYLGYVIFGYCTFLVSEWLERILSQKGVYLVLCLLFTSVFAVCVYHHNQTTPMQLIWYDSGRLMGAAMFTPFVLLPLKRFSSPVVKYISIHAFAIYLIHNLVLAILRDCFPPIAERGWRLVCIWSLSIVIPLAVTLAFSKFPRLKKWLFLAK